MARHYYLPNTAPNSGVEHCGKAGNDFQQQYYPGGCKLLKGHEGACNHAANWNGHAEVTSHDTALHLAFRHWHGYGELRVASRAEADAFLAFLAENFDETFGTSP